MSIKYVTWPVGLVKRSEVLTLASRTGVSPREAAAAWMELVETASCQESAPVLSGASLETIDRLIGLSGFAASLARVGWLTQRSDGVHIMQWDTHWCPSVAGRAASTARRREARASARQVSGQSEAKCPDKPPHTPPVCTGFDFSFGGNTAIQEAWKDFHSHREQKDKKGWTQSAQLRNAKKVADIAKRRGPAAAIVAIGRSVECGWTGIFEPPKDTEHDLRLQATNDTAAWYHALPADRKQALLAAYRDACRTMSKKDQDRPGAFMRWAEQQRPTP